MSKSQRTKGRIGQSTAAKMLTARGWTVDPITAGVMKEDIIGTDPSGKVWSIEVKNTLNILSTHLDQSKAQARKRKLPWMLLNHIDGSAYWLVRRRGLPPELWNDGRNLL